MKKEWLFVDLLDGKWSLGIDDGHETKTLAVFEEDFEDWLYPEQLGIDYVINVFRESLEDKFQFNLYKLPVDWKDIVTNDKGKDGKKSIHDIMEEV